MTWEWFVAGAVAVLALVVLVLLVALSRLRARTRRDLATARAEAAELRQRLERLEQDRRRPAPPLVHDVREYRITELGDGDTRLRTEAQQPRIEAAPFTDLVLRESVIRLGSLAHGVRRALRAETRHRIRFEMRREIKRARKQRRAEMRSAHREWQARQRETLTEDDLRDSA